MRRGGAGGRGRGALRVCVLVGWRELCLLCLLRLSVCLLCLSVCVVVRSDEIG